MMRMAFRKFSNMLKIENPYTFETIAELPYLKTAEAESALNQSSKAFTDWKRTSLNERISVVQTAMKYFDANKEEIAKELTQQMGKPYKQSVKEINSMLSIAKSLCSQSEIELKEEIIESTENSYKKLRKDPIGPVFLLSPYNFPLISVINSLVPAILSGNPVIIKPSPYTPLSSIHFEKAFDSAGPKHLVQSTLINTKDVSKILESPIIRYVHLVGHSETGRTLYREIAHKRFIDIGLFLSSNNGVYVAPDANIGTASSQIIKSAMEISGQSSYRYSRVFVHKDKFEEFLSLAEPIIMSYTIGDPLDEVTNLGPITEPDTIDTLTQSLDDVVNSGGQVLCGGKAVNDDSGKGRFFEPTLITSVDDSFAIMRLENFGPVVIVESVENEEEAVKRINGTDYGLIGGVYSNDLEKAEKIAEEIEAGTVLINNAYSFDARMPMSGRKMSGRNTVYSHLGFRHFYVSKAVQVKFRL